MIEIEKHTNHTYTIFDAVISFIRKMYDKPEGFIPLHVPIFNGKEKAYVLDCIDSTFVSSVGAYVDRFERMMEDYTGAKYAVATVNGTLALHLSLLLADVKGGDLVITQPISFIATCNAISYTKAQPVFVDIERNTLGLSPEALKDYLVTYAVKGVDNFYYHKTTGQRFKACVPMHTFGHPARIEEIAEICTAYKITLIEDAAESIGSSYKGKHTGTFGELGTFSFNGNKTITAGGGGIIVTDDEKIAKRAKHLTTQAKIPHAWDFNHDEIGYNYRLPNINAALACAQLEQLPTFLESKKKVAMKYKKLFSQESWGIEFVNEPINANSNFWLNSILFDNQNKRHEFLSYTKDKKIMTRPAWGLLNKQPMFLDALKGPIPIAENISDRLVNLPSSPIKT